MVVIAVGCCAMHIHTQCGHGLSWWSPGVLPGSPPGVLLWLLGALMGSPGVLLCYIWVSWAVLGCLALRSPGVIPGSFGFYLCFRGWQFRCLSLVRWWVVRVKVMMPGMRQWWNVARLTVSQTLRKIPSAPNRPKKILQLLTRQKFSQKRIGWMQWWTLEQIIQLVNLINVWSCFFLKFLSVV